MTTDRGTRPGVTQENGNAAWAPSRPLRGSPVRPRDRVWLFDGQANAMLARSRVIMGDWNPSHLLEQTLWDLFWIPPDITVIDRPELLALACPRPVTFLNTVLRTRASANRLPALIAEVAELHQHSTSRWVVTDTTDRGPLDAALAGAGYQPGEQYDARILHVDDMRAPAPGNLTIRAVTSIAELRLQNNVIALAFGTDMPITDDALAKDLALCTGQGARVHRFLAYDGRDRPVAGAAITVFPALRFGLLWGGGTVPEARGQGAYTALLAVRVARARSLGVTHVGLYARTDTSSPIVARQGFGRFGTMTHWKRPRPGDSAVASE